MTAETSETSLDAIRREIDSIDDQILQLLVRRFAATAKVKATKSHDGSITSSPFRPAREASVMRRLIADGASLDPEMLVRLWRVILSASIQSQAPVTLHVDAALAVDQENRLLLAEHFCGMTVAAHGTSSGVLAAIAASPGDLAIIDPQSDWARGFTAGEAGAAQVIATLPVIGDAGRPQLLVLGHAMPQPSGNDETLLLLHAGQQVAADAQWQGRSGSITLCGIAGFHDGRESAAHPGACIAGRYPRPFKVKS